MRSNIGHVSITGIAQRSGLSEEEVEHSFKKLADSHVWEILTSYKVTDIKTGKVERFKVIRPLYSFYHPGEIEMCS